MEQITFCIPYYGKEQSHMNIIETCVKQIVKYYPNNPILVCKTSDSYMPDLSEYKNTEVYNAFIDGSHILGAIELCIRVCKTKHFIICHDSIFLIRMLPEDILEKKFYSLWHFDVPREDHPVVLYLEDPIITIDDINKCKDVYNNEFGKKWYGIFGPAFGGSLDMLEDLWRILNINNNNINKYLGRSGLMACERYLAIIFTYMGFDTMTSLNGSIYDQKIRSVNIPDFNTLLYDKYFYKIWQFR